MSTTLAGRAGELASTDGVVSVARFASPQGIAVDGPATVYVAEEGNDIVDQENFLRRIRRIGVDGLVTTLAGSPTGRSGSTDGVGTDALFRTPRSLVTDSQVNVYVADSGNHTIRKISPQAVVSTVIGRAGVSGLVLGALPAGLAGPAGIALTAGACSCTPGPMRWCGPTCPESACRGH